MLVDLSLDTGGAATPIELRVSEVAPDGAPIAVLHHATETDYTGGRYHLRIRVPLSTKPTPYFSGLRAPVALLVEGFAAVPPGFIGADAYVMGYEF